MTAHEDALGDACRPARGRARAASGALALMLLAQLANLGAVPGSAARRSIGPATLALRLNPNVATRDELMLLPGIGPRLADNIIAYRSAAARSPAFITAEDLDRVPRIGRLTVETLRRHLVLPAHDSPDTKEAQR